MMLTALKQAQLRISRLDRTVITAVVLLSSVFPVELFPNTLPASKGLDGQYSGTQGQVLMVKVKGEEQATEVKGDISEADDSIFPGVQAWGADRLYRVTRDRHARRSGDQ